MSIIDHVAQTLYDKKSFNILALNVKGLSTFTDTFIIAEGSVGRHVIALADYVEEALSKKGETALHIEGRDTGEWVVLDYGDFIIHLLTPEMRERYMLEELWHDAAIVDLDIEVNPEETFQ